jgi:hypothetical protein
VSLGGLLKKPSLSREKGKGIRQNSQIAPKIAGSPVCLLPSPLSPTLFSNLRTRWLARLIRVQQSRVVPGPAQELEQRRNQNVAPEGRRASSDGAGFEKVLESGAREAIRGAPAVDCLSIRQLEPAAQAGCSFDKVSRVDRGAIPPGLLTGELPAQRRRNQRSRSTGSRESASSTRASSPVRPVSAAWVRSSCHHSDSSKTKVTSRGPAPASRHARIAPSMATAASRFWLTAPVRIHWRQPSHECSPSHRILRDSQCPQVHARRQPHRRLR